MQLIATKSLAASNDERLKRQVRRMQSDCPDLWARLDRVTDPEIPVLSIWDMGILQDVQRHGDQIEVSITPTYSGCPAIETIIEDIQTELADLENPGEIRVQTRLAPAWTTDWMTEEAQARLRQYGIAPPDDSKPCDSCALGSAVCPQCNSDDSRLLSEFGSTACKALYQCNACGEPFDHFKRI